MDKLRFFTFRMNTGWRQWWAVPEGAGAFFVRAGVFAKRTILTKSFRYSHRPQANCLP
ncbi:MAG: hypothetical protein WA116_08460 [Anaerolineaceae bacterium]